MTILEWVLSTTLIFIYVALLFTVRTHLQKRIRRLGHLGDILPASVAHWGGIATETGLVLCSRQATVNRSVMEAEQSEGIGALEQQQAEAMMPPGTTPPGQQDQTAQLQQLTELKEKGVLTESEFEVEKQRILRGG